MTTAMMTRPSGMSETLMAEPAPEHGRAKEPLPIRPPRPQHPYVTFNATCPTSRPAGNVPDAPAPTRSPRPLGPDTEPSTTPTPRATTTDDMRCPCGRTFDDCRGCKPSSASSAQHVTVQLVGTVVS